MRKKDEELEYSDEDLAQLALLALTNYVFPRATLIKIMAALYGEGTPAMRKQ
jgi:hypothetical protein